MEHPLYTRINHIKQIHLLLLPLRTNNAVLFRQRRQQPFNKCYSLNFNAIFSKSIGDIFGLTFVKKVPISEMLSVCCSRITLFRALPC